MIVTFPTDAKQGALEQATVTLSGTAETDFTIDVPDWARIVRIFPRSADVRFAIDEAPSAAGAAFATGAVAKADEWEVRLLPKKPARVLHLKSATASVVVDLEAAG